MGGSEDNTAAATPQADAATTNFAGGFVAPTPEELDAKMPQFEVIELVGQGGMGAVYKARQPRLDRFVAIKVLPIRFDGDGANFAERFEREARAMAQMNHPNIVTVHDFGETEDGLRFIVMEYVDGTDLHSAIASGELTLKHALSWIPQICAALEYAHDHDVIHRDIKPANILISGEGQIKVGDFGLAKLVGKKRETDLTQTKVSMGTPDYAAPEALQEGGDVDNRADIYSLGVLFYELLTGRVPRGAWKAPSAYCEADARYDQIIVKAMQTDPTHRYQHVSQISQALRKLNESPREPAASKPQDKGVEVPTAKAAPRRESLHPLIIAGIVLGAVCLVGGLLLLVMAQQESQLAKLKHLAGLEEPEPAVPSAVVDVPVSPDVAVSPGDPVGTRARDALGKPVKPERKPAQSPARPVKPEPFALMDSWTAVTPAAKLVPDAMGPGWEKAADGLVYAPTEVAGQLQRRGRVVFFPPVPTAYALRFALEPAGEQAGVEVYLPTSGEPLRLALGVPAPGGGDRTFAGLAGPGHREAPRPDEATRRPLRLDPHVRHEVMIRVVNRGKTVGIEAMVDDELVTWWSGDSSRQRGGPDTTRGVGKRLLVVTALGPLKIMGMEARALPADAWLEQPEPGPEEPSAMDLLTRPTPSGSPGEMGDQPLEGVKARLAQIRAKFENQEAELATAVYERKVSELQESYQAALNRALNADSTLPTEAAVQRELNRIRDQEPIEADDSPEMPAAIKDLRSIYRTEIGELDEGLRLALAPILREHLASLQSYRKTGGGAAVPGGLELIDDALARVQERLDSVVEMSPEIVPAAPVPAKPATSALQLSPPPFPPERLSRKGGLVLLPRAGDVELPETIADFPAGLETSVVDVAATGRGAIALKSNGTVEFWGKGLSPENEKHLESIGRIVRVRMRERGEQLQVALLLENGTVTILTEGWNIPGARDAFDEVAGLEGVVDIAITARGGLALLQDGKVVSWGGLRLLPTALPPEVVAVRAASGLVGVLGADGRVHAKDIGVNERLDELGTCRDLQLGSQENWGAVSWSAQGRVRAFGVFAPYDGAASALSEQRTVGAIVAGHNAFGIMTEDMNWNLFGSKLDPAMVNEALKGCSRVAIGKDFILALRPDF